MTEGKSEGAFRTIGELSADLGVPQHILRYWETRFPQLRPLTRAGNRRYYRPEDVALARRIHQALNHDGFTIKGVQKLLASGPGTLKSLDTAAVAQSAPSSAASAPVQSTLPPMPVASLSGLRTKGPSVPTDLLRSLNNIRDQLAAALES